LGWNWAWRKTGEYKEEIAPRHRRRKVSFEGTNEIETFLVVS
jgi:hypothetical protein